ncbi:MAG TPA: serine/threonine-protein kinase, partial [Polyangiales bacterium]
MAGDFVGQTIADGRFDVIEKLGEGAMGQVYRARQVAVGRMVALKLIHVDAVRSTETAARFQREMKLTARIEHANTVRVYDFGTWQGQLYLAMELLRGKTLRDELATAGRFPLARIVHIARQVLRALAAAHSEGIVHRDLKPENIMLLDQYGERDLVKVLDFGIAKSFDEPEEVRMTGAGAIIGTPAYMSPEQAMGQRVDPRSDLYSLGIMLFEMASGR